jgi:hypothetical protein
MQSSCERYVQKTAARNVSLRRKTAVLLLPAFSPMSHKRTNLPVGRFVDFETYLVQTAGPDPPDKPLTLLYGEEHGNGKG